MSKKSANLALEQHSIDFVPLDRRYGTPLRLFTIWFSVNLSIVCLTVGTLGVNAGLPFAWTALALAAGNAVGTVFMAAHSAQGPHLGVPQMIQSRAQFGVIGAALPLLAAILTYTLYTAANALVVRASLVALLPVGGAAAMVALGVVTLLIAFVGYELIHRMGALLAVVSGGLFAAAALMLVVQVPASPALAAAAPASAFPRAAFLLTLTQAAAWSLSFGPYVADYSRYLPPQVSVARTFWFTGLGNFAGATLIMMLGAYLAARFPAIAADPGTGLAELFGSGRQLSRVVIIVAVLEGSVMNLYSAYMASVTIFSGFRRMDRIGRPLKFTVMFLLVALATAIAIATQDHFDQYFGDMLSAMIYLLVPWSAINLADYYLVRRGRYAVAELFDIHGRYGAYRWPVIATYVSSVAIQVPFMSLSFYVGPVASWLGADLAWIPGLVVPAALYCHFGARWSRDLARP